MFGLLRNHKLIYRKRWEVDGDVTAFAFTVAHSDLHARAGQHIVVAATTTMRKPFSLASAPEEEFVIIGTSLRSGSAFKKRFAALTEGESIAGRGPVYTYFKPFGIDSGSIRPVVMLAQGVGVTPFRSILGHLALTGQQTPTHLIHVADHGHPFRDDTLKWATQATYVDHADEFREATATAVGTAPDSIFYVAGAPAFTSSIVGLLQRHGLPREQIKDDPYLFYRPSSSASSTIRGSEGPAV